MSGFSPVGIPALIAEVDALQAPVPAYVAGRWYPMATVTASGAGVAAASGTVTVVGVGSFQIAVYANNPATMRPTGAVLARTGDILSTSLAAVSGDITGANVALAAGVYWAAVNVDATSASATFTNPSAGFGLSGSLIGSETLANVSSAAGTVYLGLTTPMAYNSWDDITAATFTEAVTLVGALLFLKAA
jgi:hypothetical protein